VRFRPDNPDSESIHTLERIFLSDEDAESGAAQQSHEYQINKVTPLGRGTIRLMLEGIADVDQAEALKGKTVFADLRDLGALLQRAGFALPVTDVDRVTVRYDSVFGLMHDLRRMGTTNVLIARRRTPLKRATLQRMAEIYAERFADEDGRLRATFEIVWLSGWAPHPDQQQPLKPGSAKTRLADALGTREISTDEKTTR